MRANRTNFFMDIKDEDDDATVDEILLQLGKIRSCLRIVPDDRMNNDDGRNLDGNQGMNKNEFNPSNILCMYDATIHIYLFSYLMQFHLKLTK